MKLFYGVGVLVTAAGVDVAPSVAVTPGVPFVGAATVPAGASGQANKSTGKSVQVLLSVQMLSVMGVISGPLQSTTCLPLFTSTVLQVGKVVFVEEVVVEVTLKVAESGKINKA